MIEVIRFISIFIVCPIIDYLKYKTLNLITKPNIITFFYVILL